MDRFWSKVDQSGECWEWTAACGSHGYGAFYLNGQMRCAHRVAYELEVGPVPEGLELDHLCRNLLCVNPEHLEPVDHTENVRRGRAGVHNARKTHCSRGHEYSEENTVVRRGKRFCLACRRVHNGKRDFSAAK